MKKLILLGLLFSLFVFIPQVSAQEETAPEAVASAKKLGVTFPIADLGNCASINECKTYCQDETNRDQCTDFAKKKGFHKAPPRASASVIQSARSELGCSSESQCRTLCEDSENSAKCASFGQKHNLGLPPKGPDAKMLLNAKNSLGCDSASSCRSVCEDPINQGKCSEFAKQTGLGGGIRQIGPGEPLSGDDRGLRKPGGCVGEECKRPGGPGLSQDRDKFCRDNPDKCQSSGNQNNKLDGPGKPERLEDRQLKNQPPKEGQFRDQKEPFFPEDRQFKNQKDPPQQGQQGQPQQSQTPPSFAAPQSQNQPNPVNQPGTRAVQGVSISPSLLDRIFGLFKR